MISCRHIKSLNDYFSRYKNRIEYLKKSLRDLRREKEPDVKLDRILDNLNVSESHRLLIKECVASEERSKFGKRFNHDWIMQCLFLYNFNPPTYQFIYDNKLFPVCSVGTVRKYLKQSWTTNLVNFKIHFTLDSETKHCNKVSRDGRDPPPNCILSGRYATVRRRNASTKICVYDKGGGNPWGCRKMALLKRFFFLSTSCNQVLWLKM